MIYYYSRIKVKYFFRQKLSVPTNLIKRTSKVHTLTRKKNPKERTECKNGEQRYWKICGSKKSLKNSNLNFNTS